MKPGLVVASLLLVALMGCGGSTGPSPDAAGPTSVPASADDSAATAGVEGSEAQESPPADDAGAPGGSDEATAPRSAVPARVDLQGAPAATLEIADGYVRLQTTADDGTTRCLEGNRVADDAFLAGGAFMDNCQDVTGQLWKLVPIADAGYYRLQTLFLEDQGKCFEGNQLAEDAVLEGAAFMDDCSEASGQAWKFVDAGDGAYRLQTQFLESEIKCLAGNRPSELAVLQGASYMDDCREVSDQLWRIAPVEDTASASSRELVDLSLSPGVVIDDTDVYYQLQSLVDSNGSKCLEGNRRADDAQLGGAAFLDDCQDVTGQQWRLVPTDRPDYYRLQTRFLEPELACFDGNQRAPDAPVDGAAYMDDCTSSTGQVWKLVAAPDGAYRLQTEQLEGENMCFDGNPVDDASAMGGPAFMSTCGESASQRWRLVPVAGTVVVDELPPVINEP